MSRAIAVVNQKGGVGKTTTAVNLGAALAVRGQRVLIVDSDPQANATSALGFDRRNLPNGSLYHGLLELRPAAEIIQLTGRVGLDLLPSSIDLAGAEVELVDMRQRERKLATLLAPERDRYDVILVDCPPSLGLLTINALVFADEVIVPVQCEYLALEGLSELTVTVDRVRQAFNPRLRLSGLVMTMFDPRLNLAQQVVQQVRAHFPQTFTTVIPRSVRLGEAPSFGQSILEYDPASKGAQAYLTLAGELLDRGSVGAAR